MARRSQLWSATAVVFVVLLVSSQVAFAIPPGALGGSDSVADSSTELHADLRSSDPIRHQAGNGSNPNGTNGDVPIVVDRPPQDPDGDDEYEDVNGDGRVTVVDSQALLTNLDQPAVTNHIEQYDFTGDSRVTVSDVQRLYVDILQPSATDADGDGINNSREIELGTNAFTTDTDGDGIGDRVETDGGTAVDTDGDGTIDARDADSDDDRVPDRKEGASDTDGDGIPDYRDVDDDGDGIPTMVEVGDGQEFAHDVDFDDKPNWVDADADGDGRSDGTEGVSDSDGDGMPAYLDNDLDNDGLPDGYERNVTETDPLANDSDSNRTSRVEADNGVIDGMEDFDGDVLGTYREYTIGTDPFEADTDGDGLNDGFEYRRQSVFDPLDADTNGDGVSDGDADVDDDGLPTSREAEIGTRFDIADTDGDGLDDGREVEVGTDPTVRDTDDDLLSDADELRLGTDPLNPDTDGDGVLDGRETFETNASDAETGVSLAIRGEGAVGEVLRIEPKTSYFEGVNASAGPTVRITNQSRFENATIRIPIDESVPESQYEDLSMHTWNGSSTDRWRPVDTTIENGTAVATVSSFSYFTVLDTDEWTGTVSLASESVEPLSLDEQRGFTCGGACNVRNNTTLILGGEPSARKLVVEQGSTEYEVVPLSNGQRIEEFYNYGEAEINSPLPIAESDTSQLFFWSGPNGLSLVVLHDKPRDGSGAAVDLAFSGLPLGEGSWVVEDDQGDFAQGSVTRPYWSWNNDNTDGGVFRGGLANSEIEITPYFNDQASRAPLTPGEITRWQVLTGQATDPETRSLELDEPVTVRVPEAPTDDTDETSGDTGDASFEYNLSDVQELSIVYQTEQTDVDPSAQVEIVPEDGETRTEALNIGTVGTVREVLNVSSLSGNATIRVQATGVNLRTQVAPQTEPIDSDGDGIPDALEERTWTMPSGSGETFSTSPTNNDTDGDGLEDGTEVSFTREFVDGELVVTPTVRSNPDEVDTDGDGLSDAIEINGFEGSRATTVDQAERYVQAQKNEDVDADAVLGHPTFTSNPLVTDSDGDTLDDFAEWRLESNPRAVDTDLDGIEDQKEARRESDPTIHDHTAPTVLPQSIQANNVQRSRYTVTVGVTDESGISAVEFIKKGKSQLSITEPEGDAPRSATYAERTFTVDRGAVDSIITGVSGFISPVSVDVRSVDIHGNSKQANIKGPDSFGQVARAFNDAPVDVGNNEFAAFMGLSSGVATFVSETIIGLKQLITNPTGFVNQIAQLFNAIINNPGIIGKLPQILAESIRQQHETRNPFDRSDDPHDWFGGGWSLGYSFGTVVSTVPTGGAGLASKIFQSQKVRYIITAVRASRLARLSGVGLSPKALAQVGRISNRLPNVDVRTGRLGSRFDSLSGPRRQDVTDELDELDDGTKRYLSDTDIEAPTSKSSRLIENSGPTGRRALDALSKSDSEAADILLEIDDAATQRRFARAYDRGEVDSDELSTALRRYDDLDADGKRFASEVIADTGDDGPDLMAADVCNSPCQGTIRAVYEFREPSGGLTDSEAKKVLKAYDKADEATVGPGKNGPGRVQERINSLDNSDVEGVERSMRDISGTKTGYKQIAGETRVADDVLGENDIRAGEVTLQDDIPADKVPSSLEKDGTEIDVNVESELTVEGETLDSPAIESKNLNPDRYKDFTVNQELTDLERKLAAQAGGGEDELVVATTSEFKNQFGDRLDDVPSNVKQRLQSNGIDSDVTIKITTYEDIGT